MLQSTMKKPFRQILQCCVYGIVMATMLAGCGGSSSTTAVLTRIAVTPDPIYIGIGTSLSLTATGNYSDGTTADLTAKVKWTFNPATIASVDAMGLLKAISTTPGATTTVTAALNGITSLPVTITLTTATSIASIDLNIARYDHTATELQAASGVLVAGGYGINGKVLKSAELYDLVSGKWTTLTAEMNFARRDHTATLLANGQVLLLGGGGDAGINDLKTAELFDPATQLWAPPTTLSTLNVTRSYHTATLLTNGKVLVVGGGGYTSSNEIYDPASPATMAIQAAPDVLASGRYSHTATLLANGPFATNGSVLIVGGFQNPDLTAVPPVPAIPVSSVELYDPTGLLVSSKASLGTSRALHSATLLNDGTGRVLVAGGIDSTGQVLNSAELYDPASNTWSPAAPMNTPRFGQTATLMPNGQVLVMGGVNSTDPALSSAELYTPDANGGNWTPTANLQFGRDVGTATLLTAGPNAGSVLVTGGIGAAGILNSVELHN